MLFSYYFFYIIWKRELFSNCIILKAENYTEIKRNAFLKLKIHIFA